MKNSKKIIIVGFIFLTFLCNNLYAHNGRTDSSGGHKDNKNVSGLGSYHYHCGGNPAHLHTNGVCPYSTSQNISKPVSETPKTTPVPNPKQNTNTTTNSAEDVKPKVVEVTSVEINSNLRSVNVGESITLTANVLPSNATDKKIIWNSSDESIAAIDNTGKVVTKKAGIVNITVNTSNGKEDSIKIEVKEEVKDDVENIVTTNVSKNNYSKLPENTNEGNIFPGIVGAIVVGIAGLLGFSKLRK